MISNQEMRWRCKRYVTDAMQASGMQPREFAAACQIKSTNQLRDYTAGVICPTTVRMVNMYLVSGVRPDDYGIPVMRFVELADEIRIGVRNGHTISAFVKATRCSKIVINNILNGNGITLESVFRLVESWEKYDVPALINDPEFVASMNLEKPRTRADREWLWIQRVWGCLAEGAKQIRDGFWVWFSDSIYRLELELISDDLYEFRGILKSNGEISTRREVHIA